MLRLTRAAAASAVAVLGLVLGLVMPAQASSFNCVTSNGCGTLHTVIGFGGGTVVAVDAKYQKATEMAIGYPDLVRDRATSVDKVQHETVARVASTSDESISIPFGIVNHNFITGPASCSNQPGSPTGVEVNPGSLTGSGSLIYAVATGTTLSDAHNTSGASFFTGAPGAAGRTGTLVVSATDPAGDVAVVTMAGVNEDAAGDLTLGTACTTDTVGSVSATNDNPGIDFSVPGPAAVTWTSPNKPAGLADPASTSATTGTMSPGTATAGLYSGVRVFATDAAGAKSRTSFNLRVQGTRTSSIVAGQVYYTLVYAPDGNWSNACLTNVGDGQLAFRPCTAGRDLDQRFFAEIGGVPQVIHNTDTRAFAVENGWTGSGRFMQDSSGSDPRVPQPDHSDNRQLNVNGTSSVMWTWGT